jgi:diacylglycerol kinase family enzyme
MNESYTITPATRVGVVINTASGSCDATAEELIKTLIEEAGIKDPKIWCGEGSYMETAFTEASAYAPDILIVLGGDGTIRSGAEACANTDTYLIALPGGTMNMLPKALYGDGSWQDTLTAVLMNPSVRRVSGGSVGKRTFYIAAIVGAPTLWAKAREALRDGDLGTMVTNGVHAFQNMLSLRITYVFSDKTRGEADALSIICPLISDALKDTERALEAAAIDVKDAGGVLELASAGAFGKWRESAHVSTTRTRTIRVSAQQDIPIILDGETMDLGKDLEIVFVPEAFKALVPGV